MLSVPLAGTAGLEVSLHPSGEVVGSDAGCGSLQRGQERGRRGKMEEGKREEEETHFTPESYTLVPHSQTTSGSTPYLNGLLQKQEWMLVLISQTFFSAEEGEELPVKHYILRYFFSLSASPRGCGWR